MQNTAKPQYGFGDFVEQAGLGSMIWSRSSYLAARYYHYIIALFVTVLLVLVVPRHASWTFALGYTGLYVIYVIWRKRMSPKLERRFYQPHLQFIRAQLGLVGITLLISVVPEAEKTLLWLLYILVILLTSKHCRTWQMVCVAIESCIALVAARVYHGISPEALLQDENLWVAFVWLGLLSFILHYLVRNIQARDETIAGHTAVNALASDVDMTDAIGAKQWQPLLTALLTHLSGECASTWVIDPKTRQLQLLANVRRNSEEPAMFKLIDGAAGISVSLNSKMLIADAARTGEAAHAVAQAGADPQAYPGCHPLCGDVCAELAVPINIGAGERRATKGVISVGFRAPSFKKRLLPDYQNFVQGLVNQAKPMLVYAQRLDELMALQKVTRQASHSLDLNEVLDSILQAVVDTLGFEFATISLVDEDRRVIRAVRGIHVPQPWLDMAVHSLESSDIQADIVRTGKMEVIEGWDDRFDRRIWRRFAHHDMIRVFTPIEVADAGLGGRRIIGTIEAGCRRGNRAEISRDQLRMLDAFNNQVAMAIEHARLLGRVQKKADVLASLHQGGQVIASKRHLAQVLEEIGHEAHDLLDADIVMLYRYHRDSNTVDPPLVFGEPGGKLRLNLELNERNVLSRLLRESKPYYSPDADRDPEFVIRLESKDALATTPPNFIRRHNVKSVAMIPLIAQAETVGVMFFNYRKRHQFDLDAKQVHELFGQQAAVALKNAEINELEHEVIVREERNRLSRELHNSVSQALFSIKLCAHDAMKRLKPDQDGLRVEFTNIVEIAHEAGNQTGFIIDELQAPIEENGDLVHALEGHTQRIARWFRLNVTWEHNLLRPIPEGIELQLLSFAREAIHNAVRHAQCRTIAVCCESNEEHITLSIRDDGVGFDPSQVPPRKLGLVSLRDIAASLGGSVMIETGPGRGTTIQLAILTKREVPGNG